MFDWYMNDVISIERMLLAAPFIFADETTSLIFLEWEISTYNSTY